MAGFKRAYTAFPGYGTLGNIESVNIIESPPPAFPLGAGTGVVGVIGEFEAGPLNIPTAVLGPTDLETTFGGLGFEKNGRPHRYPVAEKSAGSSFPWNGNAFVQMNGMKFAGRLIVCRVDNSAGSLTLNRLACLTGTNRAPFALPLTGATLQISVDGGAPVTGTWTAAQATKTGTGATFPTGFVGGETLEVRLDGGPAQVFTFTAADQTNSQVVSRINSQAAATIADLSSGQVRISSRRAGWGASVEITGGTARTALGFPTAAVRQVLELEITGAGTTGAWSASFDQEIDGASVTYTAQYTSDGTPAISEIRDGLYSDFLSQGIPYVSLSTPSAGIVLVTMDENRTASNPTVTPAGGGGAATFTIDTAAVLTLTRGTGNVQNSARVTQAEFKAVVDALADVVGGQSQSGYPMLCADATPGSGTIQVTGGTGLSAFGFNVLDVGQAGVGGIAGTIPAGTLFQDSTTEGYWISLQDVAVSANVGGPYQVKVRPAVDDDTCPTSDAGDIDTVVDTLFTAFSVTNASALSRLTDAQMDARYQDAIDATIDASGIAHDIQILVSARVSEAIGVAVRTNCINATASGHSARKGVVAPPIGTSRVDAKAATGVGVGSIGRHERVTYCFPGLVKRVSQIASVGSTGGTGFTDDGLIECPSHFQYASVRSILNPEENAGQELGSTNYGPMPAVSLENDYNREKGGIGLTIDDYIDFKAQGIVAPRADRVAGMVFQSDVTSVNPLSNPALTDNKRRYFGDFLMDTLHNIGMVYEKKLNTPTRRRSLLAEVNTVLEILKSPGQPDASRLEDYRVIDETSPQLRGAGFQIMRVAVRQYASMDYIIFRLTSGTTVSVEELAA